MLFFILGSLILLGGGLGVLFAWASGNGFGVLGSIAATVVLFMGLVAFTSFHTVNNGHIGIVKQFGSIVGTTGEGLVTTAPWQTLDEVSVQNEIRTYIMSNDSAESTGAAVSSDSQPVSITVVVDYSLERAKAVELYRQTGGAFVQRKLDPAVPQLTKEVTANYKAVDVARNREQIRQQIETALSEELEPLGIRINTVSLPNFAPTKTLSQAIEETVQAEQQAKRAAAQVAIKEAEAKQRVAEAEGLAQAQILQARAEAQANRLVSQSLTPEILQNRAIEKFSDNVQIVLLPSGNNFLLDTRSLLSGVQEK